MKKFIIFVLSMITILCATIATHAQTTITPTAANTTVVSAINSLYSAVQKDFVILRINDSTFTFARLAFSPTVSPRVHYYHLAANGNQTVFTFDSLGVDTVRVHGVGTDLLKLFIIDTDNSIYKDFYNLKKSGGG